MMLIIYFLKNLQLWWLFIFKWFYIMIWCDDGLYLSIFYLILWWFIFKSLLFSNDFIIWFNVIIVNFQTTLDYGSSLFLNIFVLECDDCLFSKWLQMMVTHFQVTLCMIRCSNNLFLNNFDLWWLFYFSN